MKIIEGMKKIKDLQIKVDDLKKKVATHCVDFDYETPLYGDRQQKQVEEWLQSVHDILKEILSLRVRIQKTNLNTSVTMELDGKHVDKSIAEWIHRRRDLANSEMNLWNKLTDKGLQEGFVQDTSGEKKPVKIRRYYEPTLRDKMVELFRTEPSIIDSTLEVINATTDLLE